MLGKGLESLIPPQKGNQPGEPQNSSVPRQAAPVSPPQQNPPAEQSGQQPKPQQRPHTVVWPQQVEPVKPVQPPVQQLPIQQSQPQAQAQPQPQSPQSIFQIELEKISPNPDQPRRNFDEAALKELANSIREFGFLQPLVVTKIERESPTGITVEYQLIAGERRYLAAKMLGLRTAPAIIRNVHLEREKLELAVIENIQRENLNPIETARAFVRLQEEFRMTQREIAAKLGKSREVVANTMRLLDLPEYIRESVEKGGMSESHARLLLTVDDPGTQKRLFDDVLANKLTTRDVKDRVQQTGGARRGRPPLSDENIPPEVRAMQDELSSSLGAPVEIRKGMNTGRITITFYSEEELENILRRFKQERGEV